jgi:hypothetical protein
MPRLVVPTFLTYAAIVSEKIDAIVRELAAVVNGGLDSANIDPATRFPKAAFLDPGALIAVVASITSSSGGNPQLTVLRMPVAGKIVAWSLKVAHGSSMTDATLVSNGVNLDSSGPIAADAEVLRKLNAPVAAAVGHVVKVTTTAPGATTFTATVFVLADHVQ